jgi:hypothetical protein
MHRLRIILRSPSLTRHVETGAVTTLLAVLILVFLMVMPGNGIWMCLNLIYSKLYSNALVVSLNWRASLRGGICAVLVTRSYDVEGAQGVYNSEIVVSNS